MPWMDVGAVVHLNGWSYLWLILAGAGAGIINGVAGGGTLLTFPVLLALGYPALGANVTSTIGIWPGYAGGAAGFHQEALDQRRLLVILSPFAIAGALAGSALLLSTPSSSFEAVAPWLVLGAAGLYAIQPLLTRLLGGSSHHPSRQRIVILATCTALVSVYGGYFGAGLGVVLLAILGLTLPDTIVRTSGLRTILSVVVNGVAALVFIGAASPYWEAVGLLAAGSLMGGFIGARVLRQLPPVLFRILVVALGLVTGLKLLLG